MVMDCGWTARTLAQPTMCNQEVYSPVSLTFTWDERQHLIGSLMTTIQWKNNSIIVNEAIERVKLTVSSKNLETCDKSVEKSDIHLQNDSIEAPSRWRDIPSVKRLTNTGLQQAHHTLSWASHSSDYVSREDWCPYLVKGAWLNDYLTLRPMFNLL